jgi:hypothetical protein
MLGAVLSIEDLAVNKINKKISNLYILLGKIENEQNK